MSTLIWAVLLMFALWFSPSLLQQRLVPIARTAHVARREEAEAKFAQIQTGERSLSPRVAMEFDSLTAMCRNDDTRDRLIAGAQRRYGRDREWSIGKAEYDLWRSRR